eukprot:3357621-Pyramimonas_sp.AAC.1
MASIIFDVSKEGSTGTVQVELQVTMLCPISVQSVTQYVQGVNAFKCVRVGPCGCLNIKNYVIRAVGAKGDELERG